MMSKNIYYFQHLNKIGGIETFFYELAKKYKDYDLTIYYKTADAEQLRRLKRYVRCKKFNNEKIVCDRAFFNFNLDIINYVDAKEKILVVHGNYKWLNCIPPHNKDITKVIAVSEDSAKTYTELTGIPCEVCYNPISKENVKKVVHLVCASRLNDPVKGQNRIKILVDALDKYCERTGNKYQFTFFTDNFGEIKSKNVCYMQPRLDIRDYIADADYVVQLSDNFEGYNYTVNESLLYNTPVIITPCNVFKELNIDNTMSIQLDFDLSNIKEVVEEIFKKNGKFKFKYQPPEDNWEKTLKKGKSTYKYKEYEVESLMNILFTEENIQATIGSIFKVEDEERLNYLLKHKAVKLLEKQVEVDGEI